MQKSQPDVRVAIDALYTASKAWEQQQQPFTGAANAAAAQGFTATEMGYAAPIHEPYSKLCEGFYQILLEAAAEAHQISLALKAGADGYRQDEERGVHLVRKVW